MSKLNVDNPLDFLAKRKEKRRKKHKQNDFFIENTFFNSNSTNSNSSSKYKGPTFTSRRGFSQEDSSLSNTQSSNSFSQNNYNNNYNNYNNNNYNNNNYNNNFYANNSQNTNFDYSQSSFTSNDIPQPSIIYEQCQQWQTFLNKIEGFIFREVEIEEQADTIFEEISSLKTFLNEMPYFGRILKNYKQLKHFSYLFSPFNDHQGLLIKEKKGILYTPNLKNPKNYPIFVNSSLLNINDLSDTLEFLPIKRSSCIEPQFSNSFTNNRDDIYIERIWEKILTEFVLIRAEKDLPFFNFDHFLGYNLQPASSGEILWAPIFLAGELCLEGKISLELPSWLNIDILRQLKITEESDKTYLNHLPSAFFFEIAYLFGLFKTRTKSFFNGRVNFKGPARSYIAKARGLIEKIQQIRESKIIDRMKIILEESMNLFIIPEIQIFETYIVNELLGAIWDKDLDFSNEEIYPKIEFNVSWNDST